MAGATSVQRPQPVNTAVKTRVLQVFRHYSVARIRDHWYGSALVTGAANGAPVDGRTAMNGSRTRQAPALLLALAIVVATLLVTATAATADPSIGDKQAQAQAILGQIQQMDSDLSKAIEAYNYANVELGSIDTDLASNGRHLKSAKQSLTVAQAHIAARLKALYVNGDGGGAVEVILGARSLDDLLDRLDVAERVGQRDAKVLAEVKRFKREVRLRRSKLRTDRSRQAQVVAERSARKQSIEAGLAERQRLLASVKDEISVMQEAERRRQAQLAAEARARLAAEQAASDAAQTLATQSQATDASLAFDPSGDSSSSDPSISAPPAKYGGVIGIAMQYLGVPYVWGGMSPSGFDCSGLVAYVYGQVGVGLPHHAASQFGMGTPVSQDELQAGDLVFFDGLGHVGLYIGGGQFIHAPHTGDVVKISSLTESWYASTYVGARRIT